MITGMNLRTTFRDVLIHQMKDSTIEFFLTGSRHFGGFTEESDFDFFCENSAEVRRWLLQNEFYILPVNDSTIKGSYNDSNCADVFRHDCGIDVQLQKDVWVKRIAQEIIDSNMIYFAKNDRYPHLTLRLLWNDTTAKAKKIALLY